MAAWLMSFGVVVSGSLLMVRACGYHLAHRAQIVEPVYTLPASRPLRPPSAVPPFLLQLEKA